MDRSGPKQMLGIALIASAMVMLVLAVLFWTGVIGIAAESRLWLCGALTLAGLVDLGVGVRFLQSAGRT
jgi:hypothetical protein